MRKFSSIVEEDFKKVGEPPYGNPHYHEQKLPNGWTITLEPCLFQEVHYVAVYDEKKQLVMKNKLPVLGWDGGVDE